MSRLSHKKSRKGCQKCKQRHVKCDETRPACLKCVAGELRCPYLDDDAASLRTPRSGASTPSLSMRTPVSMVQTPTSSSQAESTLTSYTPLPTNLPPTHGVLDMVHLELLNHIIFNADLCILNSQFSLDDSRLMMQECMNHALSNPYLMHELLSFSAAHLSIIQPSKRATWKHTSTTLQTHALSLFNSFSLESPTVESFTPKFLFATTLSVHLLHDAILSPSSEIGPYIDGLVNYLRLAKGVRMQLTGPSWASLENTAFLSIYKFANKVPHAETAHADQLLPLEMRLKSADISPSSLVIYQEALNRLKSAYQAHNGVVDEGTRSTSLSAIFAWPILVEVEFTDLLEQRRPEALVILAHFAVVLHYYRDIWIFGDGGRCVIECVSGYLGGAWRPWLEWAREEVGL